MTDVLMWIILVIATATSVSWALICISPPFNLFFAVVFAGMGITALLHL
jgi:hypothetical protein